MNKKLVRKYVYLCLPFMCGIALYGIGSYNIVSSLLFFGGGYIAIKNLFDYRKIVKNKNKANNADREKTKLEIDIIDKKKSDEKINVKEGNSVNKSDINCSKSKNDTKYRNYDDIPGLKSTRRYIKVRRRIK